MREIAERTRKRFNIPKKGSRRKDSEKHETKPELEYVMDKPKPITKTTTVKKTAEKRLEKQEKRLPITDPGTQRLKGDIKALDILDLFGGGVKTNIIEEKLKGNIPEALNIQIKKIMNQKTETIDIKTKLEKAIQKLVETHVDTLHITQENKIKGNLTEEKIVDILASVKGEKKVEEAMTFNPVTAGVGYKVADACKVMVRNNFNRLPIVSGHELKGIVTYADLLKYFSKEMFTLSNATMEHEAFNVIIENIMTEDPFTISGKASLNEAGEKMKETGHGGIPVTEGKQLIGILTRRDIIKMIK